MKIEILHFEPFEKGAMVGKLDFTVDYENGKSETFRNLTLFSKDGKEWLNFGNCKRDEQWLPTYERKPATTKLFQEAIKAFKEQSGRPNLQESTLGDDFDF
jgi:hypothetical protein